MCGRFVLAADRDTLALHLEEAYAIDDFDMTRYEPRYNIAPSQDILALIGTTEGPRAGFLKWGYAPFRAKGKKTPFSVINARSETLLEKPFFADSLKKRRCVVLASGFYEWVAQGTQKTPMHITLPERPFFPMAGIYTPTTGPHGEKTFTCAIVTVESRGRFKDIHHRMPKILKSDDERAWLDPTCVSPQALRTVLEPEAIDIEAHPVSHYVNDPSHEGPRCLERA